MRLYLTSIFFLVLTLGSIKAQDFNMFYVKGDSCRSIRDFSGAIKYYKKALSKTPAILLKNEDDVKILSLLGSSYAESAEYQKSIEAYIKYIKHDLIKDNDSLLSATYNNIGINYLNLKEYEKSLEYFNKCIEKSGKNNRRLAQAYNNIASAYQFLEDVDLTKKNLEKAKYYIEQLNDYDADVIININLGYTEMQDDKLDFAFNYFEKAKAIAAEHKDTLYLIMANISLGEYYIKVTDYQSAKKLLDWAIEQAKRLNVIEFLNNALKQKVLLYESKNDYKNAYENLKIYKASSDSIFELNSDNKYAELEAKYSMKEKEKELLIAKKEQLLTESQVNAQTKYIWMLSVIVLSVLSLTILIFIQRIKRNKSREELIVKNREINKSKKQLEDLNYQYEKLIEKYERNS